MGILHTVFQPGLDPRAQATLTMVLLKNYTCHMEAPSLIGVPIAQNLSTGESPEGFGPILSDMTS